MATINVPFELDLWCEGCSYLNPKNAVVGEPPRFILTCEHILICRCAVRQAQVLATEGGGANG